MRAKYNKPLISALVEEDSVPIILNPLSAGFKNIMQSLSEQQSNGEQ